MDLTQIIHAFNELFGHTQASKSHVYLLRDNYKERIVPGRGRPWGTGRTGRRLDDEARGQGRPLYRRFPWKEELTIAQHAV